MRITNILGEPAAAGVGAHARRLKPRVEQMVPDINQRVHDRVDHRCDQRHPHDRWKVETGGRGGGVAPQPRPGEDCLGQHRAREQAAERDADRRQHRDHRVLERVAQQHHPLVQPLGPRRTHIILHQHFEQRRTGHAQQHGGGEIAQRDRRERQVGQAIAQNLPIARQKTIDRVHPGDARRRPQQRIKAARPREPAQSRVEHRQHQQPHEEDRQRAADQRERARRKIDRAVVAHRSQHTQRNAQDQRHSHRSDRELDRRRQEIAQVIGHRAPRADRDPQVAAQQPTHVDAVLFQRWPVEPVLPAEGGDLLLARVLPQRRHRRIDRHELRQGECDHRDAHQHQQQPGHTPKDKP